MIRSKLEKLVHLGCATKRTHTISVFLVSKKEYAIMFGLLFAFWRFFVTTIFTLQGHNTCVASHLCLVSHSFNVQVYSIH